MSWRGVGARTRRCQHCTSDQQESTRGVGVFVHFSTMQQLNANDFITSFIFKYLLSTTMTICCFSTCLIFLFFLSSIARILFEFLPLQCSLSGNSALACPGAWNPWSSGPGSRTNCIAFKSGYLRISQVLALESVLPLERLAQALVSKGSGSHLHGLVRPFGLPYLLLLVGYCSCFGDLITLCFSASRNSRNMS